MILAPAGFAGGVRGVKKPVLLLAPLLCLGGWPAGAEDPEPKEITIHLRGNKTGAAALLDAAAKGTTATGIADFDSLSAVYGLMGIYRQRTNPASSFYGHWFRLRFPSNANVIGIAEAYRNLPGIQSARSAGPVFLGNRIHRLGGSKDAIVRIPTKVAFGTFFFVPFTVVGAALHSIYLRDEPEDTHGEVDPWGGVESIFFGLGVGGAVGFSLGVTAVDPYDSFPVTLLAGVTPGVVGFFLLQSGLYVDTGFSLAYVIPQFSALIISEIWRNPPEDHLTSFSITPTPKGGLSAVAALRF